LALRLLLDEHISEAVADGFRARNRRVSIAAVSADPKLRGLEDDDLLTECARLKVTLVTYDCRTIKPLLKRWADEGRSRAGVVFIDEDTIAPQDSGALIRALQKLANNLSDADLTDFTMFLAK
jgi:hypothetical protein